MIITKQDRFGDESKRIISNGIANGAIFTIRLANSKTAT